MNEFGEIMQHGYVVEDVEATAAAWVKAIGAGPFYVMPENRLENYYYKGVRTPHTTRLCFGYWGEIQIEFIQPLDDAETLYADALRTAPGALNHMATVIDHDLDALLAKHNITDRILHHGDTPSGLKFVYLGQYLPGGHHLEIIQPPPGGMTMFEGMKALARAWDGQRPIRSIMDLGADLQALGAVPQ